jgi:hypothetical protein
MIRLLPILAVLLLCGCAPYRQVNIGADLPVYTASPAWMAQQCGRPVNGFTTKDGIWINRDLAPYQWAATFAHEVAHRQDFVKDHWLVLDAIDAPRFRAKRDAP